MKQARRSTSQVRSRTRACGQRHFYGPLPARTPEASACGPKPSADGSGGRVGSLQPSKSARLLAVDAIYRQRIQRRQQRIDLRFRSDSDPQCIRELGNRKIPHQDPAAL